MSIFAIRRRVTLEFLLTPRGFYRFFMQQNGCRVVVIPL
jgi:hypothetical protein